jgi:hypothetical protein
LVLLFSRENRFRKMNENTVRVSNPYICYFRSCNITAGNRASIKLFKEAGFEECGRKKEWLFNGSNYDDELLLQRVTT